MNKKKTSKKHIFSLKDMPIKKTKKKMKSKLKTLDPDKYFKDTKLVGKGLLQALEDNDPDAFIEILDAYLRVNRTQVAKKAKLARATVQGALSTKGNPTIRTIAKIAHYAIAS
ncbi:MAG: DNA-binding protein [Candidatus Thorarchaeota archaeon]